MATRAEDQRPEADLREEKPSPPTDETDGGKAETTVIETRQEPAAEPTRRAGRMVLDAVRFLMAGALMALLGMFAAANDQSVEIDYLVDSQSVALAWPLAGMAVGGAFLMLLLRGRRRRR